MGAYCDHRPIQVKIADDDGQQIVEVMRDATGELADGFELLRLTTPSASLNMISISHSIPNMIIGETYELPAFPLRSIYHPDKA